MPATAHPHNQILSRLEQPELVRVLATMELVPLVLKQVLVMPDEPIEYVYFPESGIISVVTLVDTGAALETGAVGFEGLGGTPLILGVGFSPAKSICQLEGSAWRLPAHLFADEMGNNGKFATLVRRYFQIFFNQCAQNSACNCVHTVEERCARWLLMTRDRCEDDTFSMTQEFLASMLGVRRTGVNFIATTFQKAGLIKYKRGKVTILDREALAEMSCGCYAAINNAADKINALE